MNLLTKKKGSDCSPGDLSGRVGHQVVRINDSIFVVGGTDGQGRFINVVHRINCQNNRIDSLILEKNVSIEGFALFCWEQTLFLWGGRTLEQVRYLLSSVLQSAGAVRRQQLYSLASGGERSVCSSLPHLRHFRQQISSAVRGQRFEYFFQRLELVEFENFLVEISRAQHSVAVQYEQLHGVAQWSWCAPTQQYLRFPQTDYRS